MELWFASALLLLAGCAAAFWLRRRRDGDEVVRHMLRLSKEIAEVADTIVVDLKRFAGQASFETFAIRCGEISERARMALQQGKALRLLDPDLLSDTVLLLHEDHRRIVDLRSELDRAAAAWLESHELDAPLVFTLWRGRRSGWNSSSFHTRPSTYP